MFSSQTLTNLNILSSTSNSPLFTFRSNASAPRSLRFPVQPLESQPSKVNEKGYDLTTEKSSNGSNDGTKQEKRISGIHVPRQRYISIPKGKLLDGILSMFDTQEAVDEFLRLSSCLDSILHAEHKCILEQMRIDYSLNHSPESSENSDWCLAESEEKPMTDGQQLSQDYSLGGESLERSWQEKNGLDNPFPFHYGLDLKFLFGSSVRNDKSSVGEPRVAVATRFQRDFMKLLHDAEFEELSARDLLLTSALNTDYLLMLPIYVDWKKASESNAIIYRRGYATERQKGFLIVEKLDYLQSKLLEAIFSILSRPLEKVGMWINETLENASQTQEMKNWIERVKLWLKELSLAERELNDQLSVDQSSDNDLPIWFAAKRAVPRYEDLLASIGPRGRLLRKLLVWIGFIPSKTEAPFALDSDTTISEPYLRPNCLRRISLNDIWEPAAREPCRNNPWKMFKTAIAILFSQSVLQEPAFEELILLFTEEMGPRENEDKAKFPSLQMKIYKRIPIPDLPVIFPHKKLSFRILDTVRLDLASLLGLLAYFVNYKFEDILSSPSAYLVDVIAISALIIYVSRVALGYKQTWDRYQLLLNKTLYEKTLASGFGSVHFLLDASEQQQYKEAMLAYAILLQAETREVPCRKSVMEKCERFMYDMFKEKVGDCSSNEAELGLVTEVPLEGNYRLQALPCSKAYEALKQRWDSLLG
ncbi:DUF3754 family protein, putative (DUF3754) isoform X2 [Tasmannia lanceolata]|uniref:DUF3754 family protein, putative (DUF3754) isoform X2 n=1 Tax=Tasmannia lanceolata TaxID=3420 RepID=UPI0040634F4A